MKHRNASGRSNKPPHKWSTAELQRLTTDYPDTDTATLARELGLSVSQIHDRASRSGIKKSAEYISALSRRSAETAKQAGKDTRFQLGHNSWNKGISFRAGGNSVATQFKPNHRTHNFRPIGSERYTKEGYLQRKMTDTGYPPHDWVPVHHLVWLAAGNQIPKGFRLCFRDGNKEHIEIGNLELVTIADLMRRNSYHNYGREIASVIQLRGAIMRRINNRQRKENELAKNQS